MNLTASLKSAVLAILMSMTVLLAQAAEPSHYTDIDTAELVTLVNKGVKVVDIRRTDEWRQTGVIPGSKLLTAFDARGQLNASFPSEFESLVGKNEQVVIICRSGNRSTVLSRALAERVGYTNVYNVAGGIVRWMDMGNQTVPCPTC